MAEAKARMTAREAQKWSQYIHKRGALHTGLNLERGFALVAMMLSRVNGGKAEMADFMPHYERPEATIDDVMKLFAGAA